jgi:Ca2+/Na+ antiporter
LIHFQLTAREATLSLLAIAVAGWYLASRVAAQTMSAGLPAPGRRAIAYCLGNLMVVVVSLAMGQPDIAVSLIFASSVTALTLVLGVVTLTATVAPVAPAAGASASASRRIWGFVLPVALIALMAGFRGNIGWLSAAILALEGLALLLLWNERPEKATSVEHLPPMNFGRTILFIVALIAAAVASAAGVLAARGISNSLYLPGAALVTALMLAPAMVLPMIGWGSTAAHEGRFDDVVTTLVGFVLINLCALLPLAAVLWIARPSAMAAMNTPAPAHVQATTAPGTSSATAPSTAEAAPEAVVADAAPEFLPFPIAVWRVDTVLLIVVGLLLVPAALGRWTLATIEGCGLLLAYLAYMGLVAKMAR